MPEYKEPKALNDVAKFHDIFNMPVLDHPTLPAQQRCELRVSLLQEELNELKDAIAQQDIVAVADALSDLQYVLSGAILEFGLADRFADLFGEVQRSNMSKTCKTMEEAKATQAHYKMTHRVESTIVEKNGEYLVYRAEDQKVLKSINYSPANLEQFLLDKESSYPFDL